MCHIFLNPPSHAPMSGEVFQSNQKKKNPVKFLEHGLVFIPSVCLSSQCVCVCENLCIRAHFCWIVSYVFSGKEGAWKSSETFLGRICMLCFVRVCLFVCSRPRRIKRGRRRESVCSAVHIYNLSSSPLSRFLSSSSLYHSSPVSFPNSHPAFLSWSKKKHPY